MGRGADPEWHDAASLAASVAGRAGRRDSRLRGSAATLIAARAHAPCCGRMSLASMPATATGFFMASRRNGRSEEHTSEFQSLMRISYAVFCLKKKKHKHTQRRVKKN